MSGRRARTRRVEGERLELLANRVRELAAVVQRHLDDVANRGACSELGHPEGFDCGARSHPGTRVDKRGRNRRGAGYRHRGDGHDTERWVEVRRRRRVARWRRKVDRHRRRVRRAGRIAGGVALAPVRMVLHPLRTVGFLLVLLLLWTLLPGDQVRYLPGTYDPATCAAPAGPLGVQTAAHKAAQGVKALDREPLSLEELEAFVDPIVEGTVEVVRGTLGSFVGGLRDEPAPVGDPIDPRQLEEASGAGCLTDPGCGGAMQASTRPAAATTATGDALLGELARRYWTSPADQVKAVQVILAESQGNPRAVNPQVVTIRGEQHQAHGLMQTLLPMHEERYGGDRWDDPDANVRVGHLLWLERGWAPWAASAGAHAQYEERARAALAGAPASAAALPAAVPCSTPAGLSTLASGGGGPVPAFENGRAQASALAMTSSGVEVRRDVAGSWEQLAAAYLAEFGTPLVATDGYRSLAGQVSVAARKPTLAAVPGTSKHGLGLAVDLGGGVERFGTAQHRWMVSNAPRFGWMHPEWARQGGRKPEPWHFEAIVAPAVTGATRAA